MTLAELQRTCARITFSRGGIREFSPEVHALDVVGVLVVQVVLWMPRRGRPLPADRGGRGPLITAEPVPRRARPADVATIVRTAALRLLEHELDESITVGRRRPFDPHRSAA